MSGDVVHVDVARQRELEAERERVRAMARVKQEVVADAPGAFPQPLEAVMSIQDSEARRQAAIAHMRILCRNIRQVEGVENLIEGRIRLSQKARETLDRSVDVFRRMKVFSQDELTRFLESREEPAEQLKAA